MRRMVMAVMTLWLGGCATTRARVTDMGANHYMVTSSGNGYANQADTRRRAAEEAVQVCAPRRAVFDDMESGSTSMTMANQYSVSHAVRPNSTLYFHCE